MNTEKFSEAMSGIGNQYVEEAIHYKKKAKKPVWVKWGAMAACLCLMLSGGYLLYQAEHRYPLKELADTANRTEIGTIPKWEDMEIYNQYPYVVMDELEYQANLGEVSSNQLGEKLGDIIASGWDEYANIAGEDANRYCGATIYKIQNISVQCAVAIQYEGASAYYAAVNSSYRPETLGQFVADLSLKDTLVVHWASYQYHKPISGYANIRFENLDVARIWDLLFSNADAVNEYNDLDTDRPKEILELSVSVPLLGYENIHLGICEKGYIVTNILSTGKMFFVGEENTKAFVDYVLNECEGHEIVYAPGVDVNAEENGVPE